MHITLSVSKTSQLLLLLQITDYFHNKIVIHYCKKSTITVGKFKYFLWAASLSLIAWEQAWLNLCLLALGYVENVCGMCASFCNALGTHRRAHDLEAVIIQQWIQSVHLLFFPPSRSILLEASLPRGCKGCTGAIEPNAEIRLWLQELNKNKVGQNKLQG